MKTQPVVNWSAHSLGNTKTLHNIFPSTFLWITQDAKHSWNNFACVFLSLLSHPSLGLIQNSTFFNRSRLAALIIIGQTKYFVNHSWQGGICSVYEFTLKPEIYICCLEYLKSFISLWTITFHAMIVMMKMTYLICNVTYKEHCDDSDFQKPPPLQIYSLQTCLQYKTFWHFGAVSLLPTTLGAVLK